MPDIHPSVYIAPTATVLGDVSIGAMMLGRAVSEVEIARIEFSAAHYVERTRNYRQGIVTAQPHVILRIPCPRGHAREQKRARSFVVGDSIARPVR